jgi:hypothetical protein
MTMRVRMQLAAAIGAVAVGTTMGAVPALAAAPTNDVAGGATTINALPFDTTVDTTQATTDADDAALNAQCGAPVTNGSVWYTYTAPAGVDGLAVDVSQSDFSAGVIIAEPDGQGGWVVDQCGPGGVGTTVVEGTTYRILAFSDTPSVTGGNLVLHAEEAAVPTVDLTVNPKGKVDRQGNALISGTVTCTDADFLDIYSSLKQSVGRFAITGDGYSTAACDGTPQRWTATIFPYNGKFAGGKSASVTDAFACGTVFCADGYVEQVVKLSK